MYIVFIHTKNGLLYGGIFSTQENAKTVCERWNKENENEDAFADYINVTEEMDNDFILNVSFKKE